MAQPGHPDPLLQPRWHQAGLLVKEGKDGFFGS